MSPVFVNATLLFFLRGLQPLGDPLFCITLPGYDGNGQGHLIQGLPLGSTYTNANLWRIKLGAGVTWPFPTVNINKVNW